MDNLEDDVVPYELIAQSLALSNFPNTYRVYFDKENGNILSITNEENSAYNSFVEFEFDVISDFLAGKKKFQNYIVGFVDQTTPKILLKGDTEDINTVSLLEPEVVTHWDSVCTVENYKTDSIWGIQLRPDQKTILKNHNLNTVFEIYIVDNKNLNFIFRTITVALSDLINSDRVYINHQYEIEKNSDQFRVFVKKFFSSVGYIP